MTHAHSIDREETGLDAADAACVTLSASQLWMLPLLLLQAIFELFSQHLAKLKEMRRSRPLPKTWREHLPALREAEWPIAVLLAEGARQLLAGEPLRLTGIPCPEPPGDFQPTLPQNALSLHLRLEGILRFNADPEAYVRRHAARIAARECEPDDDDSARPNPTTTTILPRPADSGDFLFPAAIRAPPPAQLILIPAPAPTRSCRLRDCNCMSGHGPIAEPKGSRPRPWLKTPP